MTVVAVARPVNGVTPFIRCIKLLLLVALLAAAWVGFGPVAIGGPDSVVVTSGVSMLPHFQANGLVLTRTAGEYHVGEVAAYHNEQLHTVVMHRIVAIIDDRYYFKGDNNNFIDSYHPTKSQIVGREWVYLPHLGRYLTLARTPMTFGVLIAVLGMFAATAYMPPRRRRRRRHHAS